MGEIEERVLNRMELLRPHQIRHPEAVTEGMNLLAQALVCLTDPVTRAAYDRHLGIALAPFEVVDDEPIEQVLSPAPRPAVRQQALPYEVVDDEQLHSDISEIANVRVVATPVRLTAPGISSVQPQRHKLPKLKRRTIYSRLAALRRASRAWEALRPVLGTPSEPLATPVAVFVFLQALADARVAFPSVSFVLGPTSRPGGLVLALVRETSTLGTVRDLLLHQRKTIAQDWHGGYALLQHERATLRKLARRPRGDRRYRAQFWQLLRAPPELTFALVAVLLIIFVKIIKHI